MNKFYAELIAEAVGEQDLATLQIVQDIMRDGRSGLDGLTRAEFIALARRAYEDMQILAATNQLIGYCDTMRLDVPGRYLN